MGEIRAIGGAPRHARSRPPQIARCPGGDGRPHREPAAAEGRDDDAGVARPRSRDFPAGRAPDQGHIARAFTDLPQQSLNVVRLRTEDDQQLRVIVDKGVVDRVGTRPFAGTLAGPHTEPAIR